MFIFYLCWASVYSESIQNYTQITDKGTSVSRVHCNNSSSYCNNDRLTSAQPRSNIIQCFVGEIKVYCRPTCDIIAVPLPWWIWLTGGWIIQGESHTEFTYTALKKERKDNSQPVTEIRLICPPRAMPAVVFHPGMLRVMVSSRCLDISAPVPKYFNVFIICPSDLKDWLLFPL